jgi:transcriptional regulator with XRE-family HTH domain
METAPPLSTDQAPPPLPGFLRLDGARLRFELARRGLTQRDFARRVPLHEVTLSAAIAGRPIRHATLSRIAAALAELPVNPLMARLAGAGYDPWATPATRATPAKKRAVSATTRTARRPRKVQHAKPRKEL